MVLLSDQFFMNSYCFLTAGQHASQKEAAKGYGGKYGVMDDRRDKVLCVLYMYFRLTRYYNVIALVCI